MKQAAAMLLVVVSFGLQAQPVYRCGNEYTRIPCPQGKVVEATDPRSAAQRVEAKRVAAEEQRLAAEMRRDRLMEQARHPPAPAASLNAPPVPASGAERHLPKKKRFPAKPVASTPFTAAEPGRKK